ncbi:MAG: hypothetical protein M1813_005222 [Trichoglossum hirsutum]|nr:MAG: hypothetical protein M1813_005222 [Trichoglossum hirsutum]
MPWRPSSKDTLSSKTATKTVTRTEKGIGGGVTPQQSPKDLHEPTESREQPDTNSDGKRDARTLPNAELAESINEMLSQASQKIIDVAIRKPKDRTKLLHRRAILDRDTYTNFMAGDVQRALEAEMQPYDGSPARLGNEDVAPLGRVAVDWHLSRHAQTTYTTTFLVVETEDFDLLLGGPVVKEYQLWRAVVAPRRK